jgi:hypothetical protein
MATGPFAGDRDRHRRGRRDVFTGCVLLLVSG